MRAAAKLVEDGIPAKLAAKDPGLWGPAAEPVAATRLGWLDAPTVSRGLLGEFAQLAERAHADRLDHIVLAGMGGSSLAPEVITRTAGAPLTVLDTTDPHQVATALGDRLDRTLVIVSSKSGSTIETDSHRRIYEQALHDLGLSPEEVARRFVIVTDPGSPLEEAARKAGYHVVLADPNVGGRYSALTAFGLTPSALAGVDVAALLDQAAAVMPALARRRGQPGSRARRRTRRVRGRRSRQGGHGRPRFRHFRLRRLGGAVARRVNGQAGPRDPAGGRRIGGGPGVLPWPGHPPGRARVRCAGAARGRGGSAPGCRAPRTPRSPGRSALSSSCGNTRPRWPAGSSASTRSTSRTSRNPRTTPPPCSPGRATGRCPSVSRYSSTVWWRSTRILRRLRGATDLAGVIDSLIWSLPDGGYLAIMAYLDRMSDSDAARLRTALAVRTTHPVTFGWGPRFLHSTGQYHKGGPQTGVFLQITGAIERDVQVPDAPYSLGRLQLAQALGDLGALRGRGRPAVRLHLRNRAAGLRQLLAAATTGAAATGAASRDGNGREPVQPAAGYGRGAALPTGTMTDGWTQGGATAGGME